MYLVFLDSSGNTGRDLAHPTSAVYYLLALAVPTAQARRLEDAITGVLRARFGSACLDTAFECKGADMYRGEGPCAAMPPGDRISLYGDLVSLVASYGARVMWQGIDKRHLAHRYERPMHPHTLAFIYLAEDVERFLRRERDVGLLIADEEKEVEEQVIADLARFKTTGTAFGHTSLNLTRIVDNVHWIKSHRSRFLQLCDCC
ncbi:MAG TPA: DUF3800 domain-containing protein, partial [Longimicrobium sp.]|nr:DUF3800 domain-containing protein [Longimicrobium sp.]